MTNKPLEFKFVVLVCAILLLITGFIIGQQTKQETECTINPPAIIIPESDCICNCEQPQCPEPKDCIAEFQDRKDKADIANQVWASTKKELQQVIR